MLNIDKQSVKPVYEQIVEQIEQLILAGSLEPNEQIPSVRSLSLELFVNLNTIQKAYNEFDISHISRALHIVECILRCAAVFTRHLYLPNKTP